MKVKKNERQELLGEYLQRVLPQYGLELRGNYIVEIRRELFGLISKNRTIAFYSHSSKHIELFDNNYLDELTKILPPWERLTGQVVEVSLQREVVHVA